MNDLTQERVYPSLSRRGQAFIIDGIVLFAAFIVSGLLVTKFALPPTVRITTVITVIIAVDPLLVTINGASVGHYLRGLKIETTASRKNINIVQALIRLVVKYLFGWLSLIFILITKRHQALHDLAAKSVVVIRDPSSLQGHEHFQERNLESGFTLPSKKRRTLIICAYLLGTATALGIILNIILSQGCLEMDRCTPNERTIQQFWAYTWFAIIAAIIVLGWRGLLWGCWRKINPPESAGSTSSD